jgi:hypothetical protein
VRAPAAQCRRGHPFDAENTYVRPDGKGRTCKECLRASERIRRRGKWRERWVEYRGAWCGAAIAQHRCEGRDGHTYDHRCPCGENWGVS